MSNWMNANEGISFPSTQIPSLFGYNVKLDENGEYHIGYKMIPSFDATYVRNELYESHFPYDLSSGTSLIFVYIDIIQYQTVGDAKATLLRVIDSNRRIKNGSACSIEPNLWKKNSLIYTTKNYSLHLYNQYRYSCTIHSKTQSFLYDTQQNTKKLERVFYSQILKNEAAKPSYSSSFVSDNPTTEESERSKPSSLKTRSSTLKPPGPSNTTKEKLRKKLRKTQKKRIFPHQRRRWRPW